MPIAAETLLPLARMNFRNSPVAVAFLDEAPAGLLHVGRSEAASCGYWRKASEGRGFFTTAGDHENCPVGAFTHGVALSSEKAEELKSLIGTMIELRYLKSEEVPQISHRDSPMKVVAYAPLPGASFEPDAVIFRGTAQQIMIVSEAARAAGIFASGAAMGRPACAVIPESMASQSGIASLGCIGNRVYTALGDDELYFAVPGRAIMPVLKELTTILDANVALETFHRDRAARLA